MKVYLKSNKQSYSKSSYYYDKDEESKALMKKLSTNECTLINSISSS